MEFINLTDEQRDVLCEIGNIGAGNAATSMAKLINKKIDMQVPSIDVVGYDDMMELIGGPEALIVAIFFRIQGDAPGTVFFILTMEEAENLVQQITNNVTFNLFSDGSLDEVAISVLQETGNILTGSYLSALSDFMHINMQPSVPYFSADMAGAVLTAGLMELSQVTDFAIIIDTKINHNDSKNGVHGHFLLLPDPSSFQKIFHALGVNENV